MKKLAMFLGCGVIAFAIGCGDGGSSTPPANPTAPVMDPKMMMEMQKGGGEVKPGNAAADPAGEKKEGEAAAEKKEGDAPAEKKEGDAPAEKKEGEAAAEKKE